METAGSDKRQRGIGLIDNTVCRYLKVRKNRIKARLDAIFTPNDSALAVEDQQSGREGIARHSCKGRDEDNGAEHLENALLLVRMPPFLALSLSLSVPLPLEIQRRRLRTRT